MEIQLKNGTWQVGQPLAGGGYGTVYEATSADGQPAVAKLVPKVPGAERELLFGDALTAAKFEYVVPILDQGETADAWVLVMPRAEKSLAQHLEALKGAPMEFSEVLDILSDVAAALVALATAEVVHRDLKPDNVLLLNGRWCLADFGISRYRQATTAPDTRKFSMTLPYAAPERWRAERATSATDVYAFGVMAYELVAGHRPFSGPSEHDFREQHLTSTPPRLLLGTNRMRNIVEECLSKEPAARPTPANLLSRLEKARDEPKSSAASRLAAQNLRVVEERSRASAEAEAARQEAERVARLSADGIRTFDAFADPLLQHIEDDAPAATIERNGRSGMLFVARLDGAAIGIATPAKSQAWGGPFNVAAHSSIIVNRRGHDSMGWEGRAHSLWYCDAFEEGRFAWYETAFMESAFGGRPSTEPFHREPALASDAFAGVIGRMQLAWPMSELDRDEPDEFTERWIGWFVDAVEGKLHRPSTMPERHDDRRWRR